MNRLLIILLILFSTSYVHGQTGFLFVKKGYKKKRTYTEGDRIILQIQQGTIYDGVITLLLNDTIYINGLPIHRPEVSKVILINKKKKTFHLEPKDFLLITAGVALTTAGLTLSKQAKFKEALTAGLVIGYSPLAINYLGSKISFRRRKFRVGKKFRLQVLDFHIVPKRGF
jgi:hypothetical protein